MKVNMGNHPRMIWIYLFILLSLVISVAGSGITLLNNTLKGSNLRVTPPAIFSGRNMEITTHKLQSSTEFFNTSFGSLRIEIGFEGV